MIPRSFLTAVLCFILFSTTVAHAADLTGRSRTYLGTRELTDGTRLTPLYEYLDVRTDSIGSDAVSFAAGGWYRLFLQSKGFDDKDTGDLQYAYLSIKQKTANAVLNIGRVVVHEGAASSQLDGAFARTDLRGGFTVAAFGGIPVETGIDTRSGDSVYGGRVAHGIPGVYAIGASYLQEKNDSKDFRKEEGLDIWVMPVSKVQFLGISTYNADSKNWMQHQYYALLGPFDWLRVNLEASKTWYRDYFASTTMSAFSFTQLDPNEVVTAAGASAVASLGDSFSITADLKQYDYQVLSGSATYAGGSIAYAGETLSGGAALHRMSGPDDAHRYDEHRAYIQMKMAKADVTFDALHVGYDRPINGESDAWTGSAALGFNATQKLRVVADGEYTKSPEYTRDVRAMLTLVYAFDVPLGGSASPAPKNERRTRR